MITLLYTFGNFEKVTKALLTFYFIDLLKKTNLINKKKCCVLAIITFICMTTFHLNTIKHIQVGDLEFKLEQNDKNQQIHVVDIAKMKKDKYLLEKDHNVPFQSTNNLCSDFLIVFMIYL
jgi:hypothetical protein